MSAKRVKLIATTIFKTLHPEQESLFQQPTGEIVQYIKLGRAVYEALRADVLAEYQKGKEEVVVMVEPTKQLALPPPTLNYFLSNSSSNVSSEGEEPSFAEVAALRSRVKEILAQDEDMAT